MDTKAKFNFDAHQFSDFLQFGLTDATDENLNLLEQVYESTPATMKKNMTHLADFCNYVIERGCKQILNSRNYAIKSREQREAAKAEAERLNNQLLALQAKLAELGIDYTNLEQLEKLADAAMVK